MTPTDPRVDAVRASLWAHTHQKTMDFAITNLALVQIERETLAVKVQQLESEVAALKKADEPKTYPDAKPDPNAGVRGPACGGVRARRQRVAKP